MSFLVVGYGQIGRELVRQLTERGDRVTVVKRSGMPQRRGAEVIQGDVQDALSELGSEGFDGVFNCMHAPYSARAWRDALIPREKQLLEWAGDVPVVFPESVYAWGAGAQELKEGEPVEPASPLGEVRAQLLRNREAYGGKTVSVVAADLIGPTASLAGAVFHQLVFDRVMKGRHPLGMGDVRAPRSITYIPDLVRGMMYAVENAHDLPSVVHAPAAGPVSQVELARAFARVASKPEPSGVFQIPWTVMKVTGLFSQTFRELHNQKYLWDSPQVLHAGVLADLPVTSLDAALVGCVSGREGASL
ncbi:NAD dependent epimerase/dehydratase family protein [Brevibacterium mcbrellneri ATCC 49030]|uniref:NAD dependent epimerase/dehydratase family protein n=1 Tax=Brevibacterium mcbrellneri ATCC 49030 TaxID=585530 RepID=D4YJK6_9MICO|nr:NAD-dependent epimerase/dehydratase family protein [Brevibacterium mcbrellneri]EFG48597.1 NAD dependent epimerase/dehydratase family protein [Brevibacterium mcbrellneri ATCC 49030]